MKIIFIYIILIISETIKTEEEDIISQNTDINQSSFIINKIYELNDTSFEYVITESKTYRWLLLFYSNENNNCSKAKEEIKNIYNSYNSLNELRYAQMNIDNNLMTKIRLDINKVPYIILLENETIYEMNLTLNYDNLEDFIFTIFSESKESLKPLPKKVNLLYIKWFLFNQILNNYIQKFNKYLYDKGILINFRTTALILFFSLIFIYLCVKLFIKYCCNDEENMIELQKLKEDFDKRKKEIENEEQKLNDSNENNQGEDEEEMVEYIYEYENEEDDEDYEEKRRIEEERKKIMESKKKNKKKRNKKIKNTKNTKNKDE